MVGWSTRICKLKLEQSHGVVPGTALKSYQSFGLKTRTITYSDSHKPSHNLATGTANLKKLSLYLVPVKTYTLPMRRPEFEKKDLASANIILSESKIAHLAYQREGEVEVLPYNFSWTGRYLYFHSSPRAGLAKAAGAKMKFLAYCRVAWIPSTWRHPELACPATTYFCSVTISARLKPVKTRREKALALELFMRKYQADEGYKPLQDKVYRGPLDALFVGRMEVKRPITKMKMGQHLTTKHRRAVFDKLQERAQPGDGQVLELMRFANADLAQG